MKRSGSTHCFDNKRNLVRHWFFFNFSLMWIFIGSLKISRMLSFRPPWRRWDRDPPLQGPRPNLRPILETTLRIRACVWPPPVL